MKQLLCIVALAAGFCTAPTLQNTVQAQTLRLGLGGIQYDGYGQGYYGGYGRGYNGYNGYYSRNQYQYSNYGNGPYGYGSGSSRMFPSNYGHNSSNTAYYNGYTGYSGYYAPSYVPVYNPYGFGVYNSYGW